MVTPAQSANGTHASYGPFYLEYSLLAELWVVVQYQRQNRRIICFFFCKNLTCYVIDSTLVIKQKLPGIYVQPSYKSALSKDPTHSCLFTCHRTEFNSGPSCLVWFGVIFIRHGLYQDGVFKFTVYIPDNYPDGECPVSCVWHKTYWNTK